MSDLLRCRDSKLLAEITKTYELLGVSENVSHLPEWREVMGFWAKALEGGYKMRATQADARSFREHAKLYVTLKALIRPGICTWYDWQLFAAFPDMFDSFGSLMLMSQEGMEACQKRQNMLMRLSNNFANAGRIPAVIKRAGLEAVKAYLKQRAAAKKSPEKWLWWRNQKSFYSYFYDVFSRVKAHKAAGRVVDWESEFVPSWRSFRFLSALRIHGGARLHLGRAETQDVATSAKFEVDWLTAGSKWKESAKVTISVETKTTYGAELLAEIRDYYAPIETPRLADDASDDVRRGEVEKLRRKRWREREQAAHWGRAHQ